MKMRSSQAAGETRLNPVINAAIVTNAPAPYRVPGWREVAETGDIHLDVIYCAQPHIDISLDAAAHGFATHFLSGRYWAMERRFMHCDPGIWSLLDRLRPDVVITTGFIPTYLFAFAWAVMHGVPHVAMTDGTARSEKSLSWLHRLVRRKVFARSAAFVGACEGSRDLFRMYGVPENRIYTSPLCADNERFSLPGSPAPVDFIFCGRFVAHKRPLFAMQVAREVSIRMGRRSSIDFVGSGVMEQEMRGYAAQIADFVDTRFHGYATQSELPSRYADARIFLFPTEADPWGVVANEACASGLPVIVSPHAGVAGELVLDGSNGYVRELDVAQWAEAAVELLGDGALYNRFSQSGRERVAGYTFDHAARGLANAIRQACPTHNICPGSAHMSKAILIATLMRPEGDTGVQTHFRSFMAYLDKTGRKCDLITPYDAPLWCVYPAFSLRKLINLFSRELGVWWYRHWHAFFLRQALRRRLQTGVACVVYAQCPLSAHAALAARVSENQRVVMVAHFNISQADEWADKGLIPNGGRLYRAIRAFEAEVFPRLDGLVFVSDFMWRELARRIPAITGVATAMVPNFLSDPGLPQGQTAVADLINIGTLEARKNQQYLLEIIAALRELGRPMTLTLVGDGMDRRALEEKARALKLDGLVRFAGYVRNAAEQIGQHRAYIHAATIESFGITLIEAMSRGLPVFAPAVGGIPEVFTEGEEGRFIPLDDAYSAARIIAAWLGSETTMRKAGIAARKRYLDCFEAGSIAEKLTHFLICAPAETASGELPEND